MRTLTLLLATNQCGFWKGFSSQYCLLVMLEKFKEAIDKRNQFGGLLTDLSKAFDCIDHKLLIAKLSEYGVSSSALNVISSYLKHRTQRTKINDCFSTRSIIEYGVPQGSILGPLLFDFDMIDLFMNAKKMILQITLTTQLIFLWYWHTYCHFWITGYLKKRFFLIW